MAGIAVEENSGSSGLGTLTSMKEELLRKIHDKTAVVGIIGLGYVGLPLGIRFAEAGFRVLGFDVDPSKIEAIEARKTYIKHIPSEHIASAVDKGLTATTEYSRIPEVDAIILCVPTPLGKHREPDMTYVISTAEAVSKHMRAGQLVSLESTTYPGTTDEELRPRIEKQGLTVGKDAFLVFSPEREDPGNPSFTTQTIPKVIGGTTPNCLDVGVALYAAVIDKVVKVSSTQAAEMTKLLENIYRAVNIGLVNELKTVADAMNIDIWEVIEAAKTKPFGFNAFYPGPGLGGHCIPIDPFYLTWKAHEYEIHTRFIELAGEINSGMPRWVVGKIAQALNNRKKCLNGSRLLVLGLAYKKNIDDSRESPSAELMSLLMEQGAQVDYSDPFVPRFPRKRDYAFDMESVQLSAENIKGYDCVLIATDHDSFDYDLLLKEADLIVDTRGRYREPHEKVVRA